MREIFPSSNPERDDQPAEIDRWHVVGRLRELGVHEDLGYLFDEEYDDPETLLGEILMLASVYDLDIDDVLRETTPIESRKELEE